MRVLADAHRLPLRTSSVDVVISNPPYPGNGIWPDDYAAGLATAVGECRRVLRPGGRGWFLLRRGKTERWLSFDHAGQQWEHPGHAVPTHDYRRGIHWGTVPEDQLAPVILANSVPGDVVLDPFAGTGGIPRLARRLGRVAVGADIDITQLARWRRY